MQGHRKQQYFGVSMCMFLLGWFSPVNAVEKVEVCHQEGNGSVHRIAVAAPAVPTHLNHGDARLGDPVPGHPGFATVAAA